MLHQLENAVEVPFKHKSKQTRIHCRPMLFSTMAMLHGREQVQNNSGVRNVKVLQLLR